MGSQNYRKSVRTLARDTASHFRRREVEKILGFLTGSACCICIICRILEHILSRLPGPALVFQSPSPSCGSVHPPSGPSSVLLLSALHPQAASWALHKKLPGAWLWLPHLSVHWSLFHNVAKPLFKSLLLVSNLSASWKPHFILNKLLLACPFMPIAQKLINCLVEWKWVFCWPIFSCSLPGWSPALKVVTTGPPWGCWPQGRSNFCSWSRSGRCSVMFFQFSILASQECYLTVFCVWHWARY